MKYIHTVARFAALLIALTACSPDVEKEDGILVEMNEDGVTVTTTVNGVTSVGKVCGCQHLHLCCRWEARAKT